MRVKTLPKYRAEKVGSQWYAMRGEERISKAQKTKRAAEHIAHGQFCADWHYISKWGEPSDS